MSDQRLLFAGGIMSAFYAQQRLLNPEDDCTGDRTFDPYEPNYEAANELAITLIGLMGHPDNQDKDTLGDEVGGTVQTLLTMVIQRVPKFAHLIQHIDGIVTPYTTALYAGDAAVAARRSNYETDKATYDAAMKANMQAQREVLDSVSGLDVEGMFARVRSLMVEAKNLKLEFEAKYPNGAN